METSLRTRRKKKVSGELAADAGLTAQEETTRVMKSAVDAIIRGIDSHFQQLTGLHGAFGFLLDATSLMSYDDSNSDMEGLHQKCRALADAYPDDIDGDRLLDEIQDCRIGL